MEEGDNNPYAETLIDNEDTFFSNIILLTHSLKNRGISHFQQVLPLMQEHSHEWGQGGEWWTGQ